MKKVISALSVLLLLTSLVLPACTFKPPLAPIEIPAATDWGLIELRATDPPPPAQGLDWVRNFNVYIANVEVHKVAENTSKSDNSGWVPLIAAPANFDLLTLFGVEQIIGNANITAGNYDQIRMDIVKVTGNTVYDKPYTAQIPNRKLVLDGAFSVGGGNKTILTLDFNGAQSVIATDASEIIFKPIAKLLVNSGGILKQITYTIEVTVSPPGSGTVSPSAGNYSSGTQVSLNAIPASGYIFSGWTGSIGESFSGNPLIVVMASNVNFIARFVPAEPSPWGNVTAYTDSNLTISTTAGQEFVIALPYTSRLTADWAASYNGSMVALVDTQITNDNPFPSGGLKWFLFKALKSGRTELTMSYGRQPQGPYAEQRIYNVTIK